MQQMKNRSEQVTALSETIYMGLDVHRKSWHLTVRTQEQELAKSTIPPQWDALRKAIERYGAERVEVVYEAGYFGFGLYDEITQYGARCVVTPPSLIPQESGNRVKTDKKDSSKLARLLAKGELRGVWVPGVAERNHRCVLRHRKALIKARTRIQLQIKAFLIFHGVACPQCSGKWSGIFVEKLQALDLGDQYLKASFASMLKQYGFFNAQILDSTRQLRVLSQIPHYRERFQLLRTIPGVGLLTAMEVLLELQDVRRFSNAEQIAAYVGLTPTQHSSGDKIRLGHITGVGKGNLRGVLTEASWTLIRKDGAMKAKYERIKARAGGKRAIVAVAHNLLLRIRRILIDGVPYATGVAG